MSTSPAAVLLINVGTPDSPSVKDVRKYLRQFLGDRRIIGMPWLLRKILVNLVIVPFRAPKSAKLYKLLWTENGSPLLRTGESVKIKLQEKLGSNYKVFLGMRYGKPDLRKILNNIKTEGFSRMIVLPLFPQYASSSTGTALDYVMNKVKDWEVIPEMKIINQFYNNPGFIDAFVSRIEQYNLERYDHVVFSYHGLPESHISKIHPAVDIGDCICVAGLPAHGEFCYKATCYETTRLITARLGLKNEKWSVGFQSRMADKWLKPFTDELLVTKAGEGVKKILIVAPSFVADCLETTIELGVEYKKLFIGSGGSHLDMVESLNDMPEWIKFLTDLITNN
jgi:protoporphyrin/coproporphyrin ferrochelatase